MIQIFIEEYYSIGCDAAQSGKEQNVSQEGAVSIFGVEVSCFRFIFCWLPGILFDPDI
jgi:hypothetical protein